MIKTSGKMVFWWFFFSFNSIVTNWQNSKESIFLNFVWNTRWSLLCSDDYIKEMYLQMNVYDLLHILNALSINLIKIKMIRRVAFCSIYHISIILMTFNIIIHWVNNALYRTYLTLKSPISNRSWYVDLFKMLSSYILINTFRFH